MKIILVLVTILFSSALMAAQKDMGLGVMLGNPTGLNGKYWLSEKQAVDGGAAWTLGKNGSLSLHSDFLLHEKGAFFLNDIHSLDLYYGLGGRMAFANDIELGLRVPVGLAHQFVDQPADVFAEIAPILNFVPYTGIEINLAVGARYYF
jgi:hypothetical protein